MGTAVSVMVIDSYLEVDLQHENLIPCMLSMTVDFHGFRNTSLF